MEIFNIVRAWKDVRYRNGLSIAEQALLPENPAGSIELNDDELDGVIGGIEEDAGTKKVGSAGCCSKYRSNKKCCGSTGIDDGDDGDDDELESV